VHSPSSPRGGSTPSVEITRETGNAHGYFPQERSSCFPCYFTFPVRSVGRSFFPVCKMSNPLNPLDWLKVTQDWFSKTERSSGFRPLLVCLIISFGFALILLFGFPGNLLIQIFAICVVGFLLAIFGILFVVKAFTQPDFCRSERHVQRMRQIEREPMGSEQRQIEARELESEPRTLKKPIKELPRRPLL
jgi:hypothetical protein